jgi:hypothetical protein
MNNMMIFNGIGSVSDGNNDRSPKNGFGATGILVPDYLSIPDYLKFLVDVEPFLTGEERVASAAEFGGKVYIYSWQGAEEQVFSLLIPLKI